MKPITNVFKIISEKKKTFKAALTYENRDKSYLRAAPLKCF